MPKHSERCEVCKATVVGMLERIYGPVIKQYSLGLPAHLEAYRGKACYESLATIYRSLQAHRGHQCFVRTDKLKEVDYFVPTQRRVVEFDESQHFTKPRHLSLSLYPEDLKVGYDRKKWMELAGRLNKHDNDPCYRDEQRAWYDTLRDFSAWVLGNAPTVRLYAADRQWCLLDPGKPEDIDLFFDRYLARTQSS